MKLNNIGASLLGGDKARVGMAMLARCVRETNDFSARCNYAIGLSNAGRWDEANELLRDLDKEKPYDIGVLHALGVLNLVRGYPEAARQFFLRCALLDPSNGTFKFEQALAVLQSGDWAQGFAMYECRREWRPERVFASLPRWTGEHGRKVYVWAEQGIGDTLQFSRYLPWLKSISSKVVLAVPADLKDLMRDCSADQIISFAEDVTDVDCEVSLMSLAHMHYNDQGGFAVDPTKFVDKPLLIDRYDGLRVGLCWACNPSSAAWRERSIPFQDLLSLTTNPRAQFYSLQVGGAAADIANAGAQVLVKDMSEHLIDDWRMTLRLIMSLDLVVTTDTSVAHLAASVGKPTIMFLARRDWWRWGNEGQRTLWYPSMTIVRAERPYSWVKEIDYVSGLIDKAVDEHCKTLAA